MLSFFNKPGAGDPALKGDKVRPIVARHVAHVSCRDDRVEKIDDYRNLIAVEQEVLDQRQRARRVLLEAAAARRGSSADRRRAAMPQTGVRLHADPNLIPSLRL